MNIIEQPTGSLKPQDRLVTTSWQIGDWTVIPDLNEIRQQPYTLSLEARAMAVLVYLAEHSDQTVSIQQLLDDLWQSVSVSDNTVRRIIAQLRKALNDDVNQPLYIATIPKKGYRLIADTKALTSTADTAAKDLTGQATIFTPSRLLIGITFTFFFILAGYQFHKNNKNNMTLSPINPVTSMPGRELAPTISADANHIIFVHAKIDSGQFHLRVQPLDKIKSHKISGSIGNPFSPSWSPNGRFLAYADIDSCQFILAELSDDFVRLKNQKVFFECQHYILPQLSWSADSQFIFFNYLDKENGETVTQKKYQLSSEQVIDINFFSDKEDPFSVFKLLPHPTKNLWALVSPIRSNQSEIWLYNPETKQKELLYTSELFTHHLSWCGQSEPFLLLNDNKKLIKININGESQILSHQDDSEMAYLTCSPKNNNIVFTARRLTTSLLAQNNPMFVEKHQLQSQNQAELIYPSTSSENNPIWANQSNRLAFASNQSGSWQIWIGDGERSYPISELKFSAAPFIYGWSKDDKSLLLLNRGQLILFDLINYREQVLSENNETITYASWSNSDDFIYFNSELINQTEEKPTSQIFRLNTQTKLREKIIDSDGLDMAESTDGKKLYFTQLSKPGLWEFNFDNAQQKLLTELIPNKSLFQVFSDGIYFHHHQNKNTGLYFYHFESAKVETILNNSGDRGHDFSISTDQTKIAFLTWNEYQADIKQMKAL